MKVELSFLVFICALVPEVLSQVDPSLLVSMMNPDVKLPPKPPQSIFPAYYTSQQQLRARQLEERRRQERQLFRHLQTLTKDQVKAFESKLTHAQRVQLVQRLRYLKHEEERKKSQSAGIKPFSPNGGENTVISGANKIRTPGTAVNSLQGNRAGSVGTSSSTTRLPSSSSSSSSRSRQMSRRRMTPMQTIQYFHKYRKDGVGAMAHGCNFPTPGVTESFFSFLHGGCRAGGNAFCYVRGMSCVDFHKSALCCPPGFTKGTLDAISYMKQMQAFMSQFQ
ncbi:uncharacterized protein LOC143277611 [Babylonia areolata]|uniref:uncharacterized protein LOC143277611 n=1 Tax=Babylonia areolata TaxID=304850 RepID=UPI003FD36550